ncbi:MAG: glycosyl hydrolase family 28-related protein [Cetobacterium sp.]
MQERINGIYDIVSFAHDTKADIVGNKDLLLPFEPVVATDTNELLFKDEQGNLVNVGRNTINTVVELQASKQYQDGDVVQVLGYYTKGDGAHHLRKISNVDDGSGVRLENGTWANIVHNGEVNVSWFGAKGDGVTDDTEPFERSFKYNKSIYVPSGNFIITRTLPNVETLSIRGAREIGQEFVYQNSKIHNFTKIIFKPTLESPIIKMYRLTEPSGYFGGFVIKDIYFDLSDPICGGLQFGLPKTTELTLIPRLNQMKQDWETTEDGKGQAYVFGVNIKGCVFGGNGGANAQVLLTRIKCFNSTIERCMFWNSDVGNLKFGCDSPTDKDNYYTTKIGSVNWSSGTFGVLYQEQNGWFSCNEISILSGNGVQFLSNGNRTENRFKKDYTATINVRAVDNYITNIGALDTTQFREQFTPFEITSSSLGKIQCVIERVGGNWFLNKEVKLHSDETITIKALYSVGEVAVRPAMYTANNNSCASEYQYFLLPDTKPYTFNINNCNTQWGFGGNNDIMISCNHSEIKQNSLDVKNQKVFINNSNLNYNEHFLAKHKENNKFGNYVDFEANSVLLNTADNIKTTFKYSTEKLTDTGLSKFITCFGDVRLLVPIGLKHKVTVRFLNKNKIVGKDLGFLPINKNGGVGNKTSKTKGTEIEVFSFETSTLTSAFTLGQPEIRINGTDKDVQFLSCSIEEVSPTNVTLLN